MFFLYLRDLCNLWSNPLCLHFNFLIRVESWRRQFHADFDDRQLKAFDWKHPRLAAIQIERPEPSGIAALGEVWPFFAAIRSPHELSQQPSPQKQFSSIRSFYFNDCLFPIFLHKKIPFRHVTGHAEKNNPSSSDRRSPRSSFYNTLYAT